MLLDTRTAITLIHALEDAVKREHKTWAVYDALPSSAAYTSRFEIAHQTWGRAVQEVVECRRALLDPLTATTPAAFGRLLTDTVLLESTESKGQQMHPLATEDQARPLAEAVKGHLVNRIKDMRADLLRMQHALEQPTDTVIQARVVAMQARNLAHSVSVYWKNVQATLDA